ncbi:hypothetical protein [Testudinibacter sp. TR-2022]|nr:hypothetical protein [Testudinibacter sp. TR-2022]
MQKLLQAIDEENRTLLPFLAGEVRSENVAKLQQNAADTSDGKADKAD